MISLMTDRINIQLKSKPNYDPRGLMGGTSQILGLAIKNGINSPCILLNSFMSLPLSVNDRTQIHSILRQYRNDSILCTYLLTHTVVIDVLSQKQFDFHVQDLLLI